ncbi:unnamed protein product [Clonostachys rosea f. rosea IK726]|uniref:Uncharacterized protein n=1 Tax=Clonostachys rosea f. rosea IK726 TaxID=1349383 RepID=A0ACA9TIF3_BIOOC|nr:unnamed protein product [Clonostachys rosea f. rosea IK726]
MVPQKASAALPEAGPATRSPWAAALDTPTRRPQPSPKFYVPSVLLPAEASKSPSVHKIHILGEDERSKFIAHALSGVYESVELLGWKRTPSRYTNIQKTSKGNRRETSKFERNPIKLKKSDEEDNSPIDHLVISSKAFGAESSLDQYKHRLREDTTVCVMTEGLGVLDDVRAKIFNGTFQMPNMLLGHMSHKLAFNRNYNSVKQLKGGQLLMTPLPTTTVSHSSIERKTENRTNFVESFGRARQLRGSITEYDSWLRFKLPSVIFAAVADPVCVLLDLPYHGLLQNPPAQRMMERLLDEITLTLEMLPELESSTVVRDYVRGNLIKRQLYKNIMAKRDAQSSLLYQVQHGHQTDIDYLNGYFLKRAKRIGLDLRMNKLMTDMVKAKTLQTRQRINTDVRIEETSLSPQHQGSSYRHYWSAKARLEQLKAQQGAGGGGGSGGRSGSSGGDEENSRKQEEARQHILNQILHPEAADRLGRIRLVKESRATDVENRLIMLAQSGQLRQKVTEEQLKDLLNAVADKKEEEKIVVSRRKGWDDDDDDLLDL